MPETEPILSTVMVKRSQGKTRFGRMNYKTRLFVLSSTNLSYHTVKDATYPGTLKGSIPLHKITVVEEVGVDSLEQSGFAFQIVHSGTSLYIIAGQQVERVNWLAKLRELISCNKNLDPNFHFGIYDNKLQSWTCCGCLSVNSVGCRKTYFHQEEVNSRDIAEKRSSQVPVFEPFQVVVIHDLQAQYPETDLNLRKGEILTVTDKNNNDENWWMARNASGQVGMIPTSYVRKDGIESRPWFYDIDSRKRAEMMLQEYAKDCTFLVRPSAQGKVKYSISLFNLGAVKHYHIQHGNGKVWVNEKNPFESIDELIEYHKFNCAGMVCRLRQPLPRDDGPPVVGNQFGQFNINPAEIEIEKEIGAGQFGIVYKGIWRGYEVAMKTMKDGMMNDSDFFDEAKIMMKYNHPNLIRLYGVSESRPLCILTEYMHFGCLSSYLHNNPHLPAQTSVVIDMCQQIASAMMYLEKNKNIHRDLAARNCLVGHQNLIKVADFGLTRFVQDDQYTASEGAKFPIKWSSPEVINYGKYSSKSDVWSYGVVMWEIMSGGKVPYPDYTNHQVVEKLMTGYRLPPPVCCTSNLFSIMSNCWEEEPERRRTFSEIYGIISAMQFNEYTGQ